MWKKTWYFCLSDKQRPEFLSCLQELSRLQEKSHPDFLVIGGAALLLQGVAQNLQWWDVDLMFRDKVALFDFLRAEKPPSLRVQFLDEGISQRSGLHFVHSSWRFHICWTNVDCIIWEGYFDFYLTTAQARNPFLQQIKINGNTYHLNLLIAHPWDVIIDKLTLERFEASLEMLSSLNKDFPHIWEILKMSGDDPGFYAHLIKQTQKLGKSEFLRENLLALLGCAKELSYDVEEISDKVWQFAKRDKEEFMPMNSRTAATIPPIINNPIPWYEYIDRKRRHNFLAILEKLSNLQNKDAPEFLLIGALALLMQNYLHYVAWCDLDLLFRDEQTLRNFAEQIAAPGLQIEPMDDDIIATGDLMCLHTMWSFGHAWVNVDYIYRPQCFQFFYETIQSRESFSQKIRLGDRDYALNLLMANPWDLFVDKLILPRLAAQLDMDDFLGKDLRHIIAILQQDHTNPRFWQHLAAKSETLGQREALKTMLLRIIELLPELGYKNVCTSEEVIQRLKP